MKYSTALIFGLGVLIASVSAECNCKATDQPCMDKCVMAANSCIVKCENTGGDSCQQACISSNWPSMPVVQKDVLADVTSAVTGGMTATATGASGSGLPTSMASASELVSTYSTTLSGGSATVITTTIKPSAAASGFPSRSSSTPSPKMDNNGSSSTSAASTQQVLSALTLASVMGAVAYVL